MGAGLRGIEPLILELKTLLLVWVSTNALIKAGTEL
jgi:hypothetical protein